MGGGGDHQTARLRSREGHFAEAEGERLFDLVEQFERGTKGPLKTRIVWTET